MSVELRSYLEAGAARCNPRAAVVLRHGREWGPFLPRPKAFGRRYRTSKNCFGNARRAALEFPAFTYVEGYARNGVVVFEHGWLVDAEGHVIDPTLNQPHAAYFGVALPDVARSCEWSRCDGVLCWRSLARTQVELLHESE